MLNPVIRLPVQSRQTIQPTSDRHLGRVYAFPLGFPASLLAIGALVQRNENDAYRRRKKYCPREEAELAGGHLCSCVRIRKFSHGLKEMLTAGPCLYLVRTKAMYSIRGSVSRVSAGETMREQPSGLKNGLRRRKCLVLTSTRPLG